MQPGQWMHAHGLQRKEPDMTTMTIRKAWTLGTSCTIAAVDKNSTSRFLGQTDDYTRGMSAVDRMVRCQLAADPGHDAFMRFVAEQACEFAPDDISRLDRIMAIIGPQLEPYASALPQEIWLMLTSGTEEGVTAAYTRGQAVILPTFFRNIDDDRLAYVMIHELFHVLSRYDDERRSRLYKIIQYEPCPPLEFPAILEHARLSNPDGYRNDHLVRLEFGGKMKTFMSIILPRERYNPQSEKTILQYVFDTLLEVKVKKTRTVMAGKFPILCYPEKFPDLWEKVGRNTTYISHPDEILADNFVRLVLHRTVPDPWVLEEMEKILLQKGGDEIHTTCPVSAIV